MKLWMPEDFEGLSSATITSLADDLFTDGFNGIPDGDDQDTWRDARMEAVLAEAEAERNRKKEEDRHVDRLIAKFYTHYPGQEKAGHLARVA